jgi:DNA primase
LLPDEIITEIRERLDMVSLVGEYVALVKRGSNHVGLCPFHVEKSPSFNVSAANKFFHCFGCKESGDAFSFLMRLDGLTFPQVARVLAERVGVEIPDGDRPEDAADRRARAHRERLLAISEEACRFYELQLREHPNAGVAQAELESRGVLVETAAHFRLGYAPHAWDALTNHLTRKGLALADAEAVGLVATRRSGSGYYDRFRGRLMFPVRELGGSVIAFSGRILAEPAPASVSASESSSGAIARARPDAAPEPKYVNSPEGPLYSKGHVLYGLHEGRVEVRRSGWAVVCEGNFDLLALHQAGFANAMAPMGTAFTATQAKLLSRFAQRVSLLFDGDAAGVKAVRAAFPLLQQHGLRSLVAELPKGQDPDSFLRLRGKDELRRLIEGARGIVEYLIDAAAEQTGPSAAERSAAIEALGPVLRTITSPVEMELSLERVAQRFGLASTAAVRRSLQRAPGSESAAGSARPASNSQLAQAPAHVRLPKLQTELLGILLDRPVLFATAHASQLEAFLTSPELRRVFQAAAAAVQETGALEAPTLLSSLSDTGFGSDDGPYPRAVLSWLNERLALQLYRDRSDAEETLSKGLRSLAKQRLDEERRRLLHEFAEAKRSGDSDRASELMKQQLEVDRERSRLSKSEPC